MNLFAIDPGNVRSAYLWYDVQKQQPVLFGILKNEELKEFMQDLAIDQVAIEMIASYGMPVGQEVFETCVWIGRFIESVDVPHTFVYRKDVKMHLCGSMRAKDGNIRQALLDRFGPPGTKKAKGTTYGISKDVWSALAVAVTHADTKLCQTA